MKKLSPVSLIMPSIIALLLTACGNLEKNITIDLPPYERILNVESYILPEDGLAQGVPRFYLLFLTETVSYYDEFNLPVIEDADVSITYRGVTDKLVFTLPIIGGDTLFPIPVYFGFRTMEDDLESDFVLNIEDQNGRKVTATTRFLTPIPHDTLEWEYDDQENAFLLTRFTDPADQENYYRRVLEVQRPFLVGESPRIDTVWRADVEQEFSFNDRLQNGDQITLGTGFDYRRGDTLTSTIYHIEKAYYDFLETTDGAIVANFSPFAQPTRILSNIEGGTGIFTAVSIDRKRVVLD